MSIAQCTYTTHDNQRKETLTPPCFTAIGYDVGIAKRSAGIATLQLDEDFSGTETHVYLGFVTEDRKERSISQYQGIFLIPQCSVAHNDCSQTNRRGAV
ncbi:MAG TPA: DUF6266 family protein [Pedobacter sp.]